MSKDKLLAWADDQLPNDPQGALILYKLASFADADCCAWSKVETLAKLGRCSERTIQGRLRVFEELGLMKPTGRLHRLEDSTRSVPLYQLAPEVEGLGLRRSMGANPAPIAKHGCKSDGGMGAAGCTPLRNLGTLESSDELSPQGREREQDLAEGFEALEAACPPDVIAVTTRSMAWRAYRDLAEQGVEVALLPAAMGRYVADLASKRRDYGPMSLQRWLAEGPYRAFLSQAGPTAAAPCGPAWDGPAEVRATLAAWTSEAAVASYLDRSAWDGPAKAITPWSAAARRWMADPPVAAVLRELGISVVGSGR